MKNKLLKKVFSLISPIFLVIPLLTSSSISLNNKQASINNKVYKENKLYIYNNQIYNSKDQLLKYYLKTHPEAISSKIVIGNIDNAIVDYDDGILNPFKLFDYDLNKVKPVYKKSNGERTPSFADAKISYANVAMIKKMYEGVTRLFPDENEAKTQRDNLIRPVNMVYYDNVPHPFYGESPLKINPLNKNDVKTYQDIFASILNDKNYQRVNSNYRRSFEVDTNKIDQKYKSLFDTQDEVPKYFIDKFHNSIEDALSTNNEYIGKNEDKENKDKAKKDSNNNSKKVEFIHSIYRKDLPKKDDLPDEVKVASPQKDAHMDDTVDNISLSFFGRHAEFKNYLKFYKETTAGQDDSMNGYTNVSFISETNNRHKNYYKADYTLKQEEINYLLNGDATFKNQLGEINISSKKGNNWAVDANNSDSFKKFLESGIKSIKKLNDLFGSQFSANMQTELVKDNNNFKGLHVKLNDDEEVGYDNDNSFWILGVDLNKFKFSWHFELTNELYKKLFPNLISNIEEENNYWKEDLYKRIKEKLSNLVEFKKLISKIEDYKDVKIEKKDIETLNAFFNKKDIKNILQNNIKEYINFYKNSNQTKIFWINRNQNILENYNKLKTDKWKIKVNSVFNNNDLESLVDKQILPNCLKKYSLKSLVDYILWGKKREEKKLKDHFSIEELKNLINFIAENLTYKEGETDLSGDIQQNTSLEQDRIIPTFIQQVVNYIKATQSELSKEEYLKNSPFLKNIILDFKNSSISPLLFKGGISPFSVKNGAYLLISEALFNGSIINKSGNGNINQNGIFDYRKDLEKQRKIVISSRPPVVRVMYNLNGKIILGNNVSKKESLLYDSQSMILEEAKIIAAPEKDTQYIFYQKNNNQQVLLLNQVSNIYVLKYENKAPRYFISHKYLMDYLITKLLDPKQGNVQTITTKDI